MTVPRVISAAARILACAPMNAGATTRALRWMCARSSHPNSGLDFRALGANRSSSPAVRPRQPPQIGSGSQPVDITLHAKRLRTPGAALHAVVETASRRPCALRRSARRDRALALGVDCHGHGAAMVEMMLNQLFVVDLGVRSDAKGQHQLRALFRVLVETSLRRLARVARPRRGRAARPERARARCANGSASVAGRSLMRVDRRRPRSAAAGAARAQHAAVPARPDRRSARRPTVSAGLPVDRRCPAPPTSTIAFTSMTATWARRRERWPSAKEPTREFAGSARSAPARGRVAAGQTSARYCRMICGMVMRKAAEKFCSAISRMRSRIAQAASAIGSPELAAFPVS